MSQELAQRELWTSDFAASCRVCTRLEGARETQNAVQLEVEVRGGLFVLVAALWGGPAGAGDGLLSRDLAIGVPSAL